MAASISSKENSNESQKQGHPVDSVVEKLVQKRQKEADKADQVLLVKQANERESRKSNEKQ